VHGLFDVARARGWGMDLMLHRTCGEELNRARRLYHSGETSDAAFVLERIAEEFPTPARRLRRVARRQRAAQVPRRARRRRRPHAARAVAVSVPYDLARGSRHIQRGFSRLYEQHFLQSLRRKVERKLAAHPDLVARERLTGLRTLYDFDDVVTGPVHGFVDAEDYYTRSSSKHYLDGVRVPTLLLSAVGRSLPSRRRARRGAHHRRAQRHAVDRVPCPRRARRLRRRTAALARRVVCRASHGGVPRAARGGVAPAAAR
jgi:predicted alpha/beta-fold hydrolase